MSFLNAKNSHKNTNCKQEELRNVWEVLLTDGKVKLLIKYQSIREGLEFVDSVIAVKSLLWSDSRTVQYRAMS